VSKDNVEVVRRGYEAVARGDIEAIRELLDPAVKWHGGDPSAPGACQNSDEVVAFMRAAAHRGGVGELVDVIDAGSKVVVILRPRSAEGEEGELRANLTTFRDGKVVEMVAYASPEEALGAARA
jgi:ketosteroid isomerase-like protein